MEVVEEEGGLCHCLLSFFHPPIPPQPAYQPLYLPPAYSNTPYNCPFPLPFSFQLLLLLFSCISSSFILGFPTHTSSFLSLFLSFNPRWKCKHLRQTEVRCNLFINWRWRLDRLGSACLRPGSEPPSGLHQKPKKKGESVRSCNNPSEDILLITSHRRRFFNKVCPRTTCENENVSGDE